MARRKKRENRYVYWRLKCHTMTYYSIRHLAEYGRKDEIASPATALVVDRAIQRFTHELQHTYDFMAWFGTGHEYYTAL